MVAQSAASDKSTTPHPAEKRFKGVRMRSWGKWVSEIRLPNTRARLWLGSYSTAEQAARAFDVAMVCLRGTSVELNFPDSPPAYAPLGLPHHHIQELAAAAAAAAAACPSSVPSADTGCHLDMPLASSSGTSSFCDESEAAPMTETNTSCSQCTSSPVPSSTLDEGRAAATFEQLQLVLDEDQRPSPTLCRSFSLAALHDELLMLGCEWDQALWGSSDSWIPVCAPPPGFLLDDDDFSASADQPGLWNL